MATAGVVCSSCIVETVSLQTTMQLLQTTPAVAMLAESMVEPEIQAGRGCEVLLEHPLEMRLIGKTGLLGNIGDQCSFAQLGLGKLDTPVDQVSVGRHMVTLLEGTVEDNLRFTFSLKTSRKRRFELAAVTTLLGHAGKAPDFLEKSAADLSGGESQVVSLIRTLQLNPEVLLLDEPTAALDPTSSREVEALIDAWFAGDQSRACIWVSHDLDQAQRMSDIHLHMSAGVLDGVSQP